MRPDTRGWEQACLAAEVWISPARSAAAKSTQSEEHTSELQSRQYLVCRLLLEKKKYSVQNVRPGLGQVVARRSRDVRITVLTDGDCWLGPYAAAGDAVRSVRRDARTALGHLTH